MFCINCALPTQGDQYVICKTDRPVTGEDSDMCRPGRRSVPSLSQHVKNLIYNISLHNRVTSFLT